MFYRKSLLNMYRLFLKSISKLWLIPLLIINVVVPAVSYLLYINMHENAEMYILNLLYFVMPLSSVWVSIFVSEVFFNDKAKDALFFFSNKKRLMISASFFIMQVLDVFIIVLLHFYCISDCFGMAVKTMCIAILFYGIAMLLLCLSKSAAMAVLILLLYTLMNEFSFSDFFFFYKNNETLTLNLFLLKYFPFILIGLLCVIIAFIHKNNWKAKAA